MAITVQGTQTGYDALSGLVHTITFPAGLTAGELVIGSIVGPPGTTPYSIYSSSGNFVSHGYIGNGGVVVLGFYGIALGGSSDSLKILSGDSSCVARWITYRVSDHGYNVISGGIKCEIYSGYYTDDEFYVPSCPWPDDSISEEHLWLIFAGYEDNTTPTIPTNFSTQVTNTRANASERTLTTCRRIFTASQLSPNAFVNSTSVRYGVLFYRVVPSIPGGIGLAIQSGRIGVV